MTGSAADADDLVQETFVRVMRRPPARTAEPWRPWLVRVAMNLARDELRRRKRRSYDGPWLPSPIETGEAAAPEGEDPAARYDLIESCSFAFLLALEALTPAQRAVLLLRDVFDYSVAETAEALGITEPNVKTTHHRARRAMAGYDRERRPPTRALQAETRRALERFLTCLLENDVPGAEAFLAEDARHLSDAGGEFHAARIPVVGREKILLFYRRITERLGASARFEIRLFNGLPGIVTTLDRPPDGTAPRFVTRCDLLPDGRIGQIHAVLATRKLTALRPAALDRNRE